MCYHGALCSCVRTGRLKGLGLAKARLRTHSHTQTQIHTYTHKRILLVLHAHGSQAFFQSKACAACWRERSWLSAHGQQLRRGSACVFGQLRLGSVSEGKLTGFSSISQSSCPSLARMHGLGIFFLHACSIARVRKRRQECTNSLRAVSFTLFPNLTFCI